MSPNELEAYMHRAHVERAIAINDFLSALGQRLRGRSRSDDGKPAAHAAAPAGCRQ